MDRKARGWLAFRSGVEFFPPGETLRFNVRQDFRHYNATRSQHLGFSFGFLVQFFMGVDPVSRNGAAGLAVNGVRRSSAGYHVIKGEQDPV